MPVAGLKLVTAHTGEGVQSGRLGGLAVLGSAQDSPKHPASAAVNGDSVMLLQRASSICFCP